VAGLYVLGRSLIPPLLITSLRVRTQTCLPSGSVLANIDITESLAVELKTASFVVILRR
jgi:hypothetical protein